MTDIDKLIAELRRESARWVNTVGLRVLFDSAADALEAQAKNIDALRSRRNALIQGNDRLLDRIEAQDKAIREALEAARHGQPAIYRVDRILQSVLEQTPEGSGR